MAAAAAVVACAACGDRGGRVCQPGAEREFPCGGELPGRQVCAEDGRGWGPCLCVDGPGGAAEAAPDGDEAPERSEPGPPADEAPLELSADGVTPLPPPRKTGGMPLLEALAERRSSRAFQAKQLPAQLLSDLLWATFGISRPESGKRTAPSARDRQEVEVYLAAAEGLLLYQPGDHSLKTVGSRDLRALTGKQPFVAEAPLNLVFVADTTKMREEDPIDLARYSGADTGFISQNLYLFCASEGLATVVRGWIDRPALAKAMGLADHQVIVLAQTVGYPAGE